MNTDLLYFKLCQHDIFLFSDIRTSYQYLQYFYFIRRDPFLSQNYVSNLFQY